MLNIKEKTELETLQLIENMMPPQGGIVVITNKVNGIKYIDIDNSSFKLPQIKKIKTINGKKYVKCDLLITVLENKYETIFILPSNGRERKV